MKPNITIIGSSNTDMICRVKNIPAPGETVLGSEFLVLQGGKGANQAVAAARAGGQVTFIACVGDDAFGEQALHSYQQDGIDIDCIQKIKNVSTGVALINVADSGENSISVAPGANAHLLPGVIDQYYEAILNSDIILMQLEIPLETVYYVARLAHQAHIPVILNPAPAIKIDPEVMKLITLITPNEQEAATLSGIADQDETKSAQKLIQDGVHSVVVTLGSRGAYYLEPNNINGYVKGVPVTAVDTTAAGDTFNGYLAVELSGGKNLAEAIEFANRAAAISVTTMGAQPSIPIRSHLQ